MSRVNYSNTFIKIEEEYPTKNFRKIATPLTDVSSGLIYLLFNNCDPLNFSCKSRDKQEKFWEQVFLGFLGKIHLFQRQCGFSYFA